MLLQKQSHPQGCWSIQCPWAKLHSQQDTGTKYYEPNTNGYSNHGFKCFHKHCEQKTIYDLIHFSRSRYPWFNGSYPLYRQIEVPQRFPMDALGPILGPAAQAMHRVIRRQTAYVLKAFLRQPHWPLRLMQILSSMVERSLFQNSISPSQSRAIERAQRTK